MSIDNAFKKYSQYYDLLYKDKDYDSESSFIKNIIQKYHPKVKTILNIGCGTGEHDYRLSQFDFTVTGIDSSSGMIDIAKKKHKTCHFHVADARTYKSESKFDCILSLFHVLSYQNTNEDLFAFFSTIKSNLAPGGLAIFDYWYGPAVLNLRPENRIKKMRNDFVEVTRFASTKIDYQRNVATVHYDILLKEQGNLSELQEDHHMRYFFLPELDLILKQFEFKFIGHFAWMDSEKNPTEKDWSAYTIIQAQ